MCLFLLLFSVLIYHSSLKKKKMFLCFCFCLCFLFSVSLCFLLLRFVFLLLLLRCSSFVAPKKRKRPPASTSHPAPFSFTRYRSPQVALLLGFKWMRLSKTSAGRAAEREGSSAENGGVFRVEMDGSCHLQLIPPALRSWPSEGPKTSSAQVWVVI